MENEKRLIDANRFEKLLLNHRTSYLHKEDVIAALANQPTVDAVDAVEVVHGNWIPCDDDFDMWYECSVCGGASLSETNYCHDCGAKMDLEE